MELFGETVNGSKSLTIFTKSSILDVWQGFKFFSLTLSQWRFLSYRNQSIDLLCKSMDQFLYDRDLRHERVGKAIYACKTNLLSIEAYSEPCQTSMMGRFAKIVKGYFPKTLHFRCLTRCRIPLSIYLFFSINRKKQRDYRIIPR